MGNYIAEEEVSNIMETTILESGKKAERMVKEHITTTTETGMKEAGGIVRNMDRQQCTSMETSIQANGMVITKGKEKLATRTELNISPPVQLDLDSTV